MSTIRIALTAGNVRNGHFCLTNCMHLFAPDVIGGPNQATAAPNNVTVTWPFGTPISTDIASDKRIFRKRSWVQMLFARRNARAGDYVVLTQIAPNTFSVDVESNSSHSEATQSMNTGTTIQIPLENTSWLERKKYEIPSTYAEIFPSDALGARGQADMDRFPARGKEVVFDYGVVTSTCDVATRKSGAMRPRDNSGMRKFLEANNAALGDIITVTRTAERTYKVSLVKR